MRFFPQKTMAIVALLSAVTTIGVYGAMAGGSATLARPAMPQADIGTITSETKGNKVVRIVGPQFFPDNGDIKLFGAAEERGKRN